MVRSSSPVIPARLRARFDAIAALTDSFAAEHLSVEYAEVCRRMAAALSRERPAPLERGEPRTWAAGILYAVGWVNFLADPSQVPHMPTAELARNAGVGESTIALRFREIREVLDLVRLEPEWTLPSRLADNPFVRMAELWEEEDGPGDLDEPILEPLREAMAVTEATIAQVLAEHPEATDHELNAALAATVAEYNRRPQAELGGLSPVQVHRLLTADWESPGSAIAVDGSLALAELDGAATLHDARLVLAMLAERERVKATPKGNLPQAFVAAFRERMGRPAEVPDEAAEFAARWEAEHPPRNEEDLRRLHVARIVLELAGLIERRQGAWSLTRRGDQLGRGEQAGALLAALVRAHFRRLNLSYLDGADEVPGLQQTVGYTLYHLGRCGGDWQTPDELADALILPAVRAAVPVRPYVDEAALILETRVLRPLQGFGLAESRAVPRGPGEYLARSAWRKSPLFDRVLRFDLSGDA